MVVGELGQMSKRLEKVRGRYMMGILRKVRHVYGKGIRVRDTALVNHIIKICQASHVWES